MMNQPPFSINNKISTFLSEITHLIGILEGMQVIKPKPELRKRNRIKTIQSSLAIEGNTLTIDQVTDLINGKRIVGSQNEIVEVKNAIQLYEGFYSYSSKDEKAFLKAHAVLMKALISKPGRYRTSQVGVMSGDRVAHMAPSFKMVPELMVNLFAFIKTDHETHPLIKAAIAHYEIEFIHPFSDGNGRMGRFWQHLMQVEFHPVFEFVPFESLIKKHQKKYYKVLGACDKEGTSTLFVEFSLEILKEALEGYAQESEFKPLLVVDRLEAARMFFKKKWFSRKEYRDLHKSISTATSSRDLADGVKQKLLVSRGEKALTRYKFN